MRPFILITNDDGILSPGLHAAVEAVQDLGDILIAAPIRQQTGMARSFPYLEDTGIIEEIPLEIGGKTMIGYGVHGSPAYCVAEGVIELAGRKPDLCISGINYGENLGRVLTLSGTVGAILEADSYDIPGIAVSALADMSTFFTMDYQEYPWKTAQAVTRRWTERILREGMPEGVRMFNINVPENATCDTPERMTRQALQTYFVFQKPEKRDFSRPHKIHSKIVIEEEKLEADSDIRAACIDRVISVTPLNGDLSVSIK